MKATAVAAEARKVSARSLAAPRLVVADGTLEALKWLGLVLMALDHVNKFLFAEKLPVIFELGRIVVPLFGFVLAYNLARPSALKSGAYVRTMKRLVLFGLLASPMFVALVGGWPLNILFMLLVAVAIMYLVERGGRARTTAAVLLFVFAGGFVEFWWFGLAYCLAAWAYCRQPSVGRVAVWILATASLYVVNDNLWALVALPIIFMAPQVPIDVPRWRWVFYGFYPAHLAVLWGVSAAF
jgi:hypothetical protein